jgi:hypothetical protein
MWLRFFIVATGRDCSLGACLQWGLIRFESLAHPETENPNTMLRNVPNVDRRGGNTGKV